MEQKIFWEYLGRIADSLGTISVLGTLLFSILTYLTVRRQQKNVLENIRQNSPKIENFDEFVNHNKGITSAKPVALLISLTENKDSIKPNVESFFAVEEIKMPFEEISMNGLKNNADIQKFVEQLNLKKREIQAKNYTEIHLFINAPIFACILTGSILKNLMPVKIYHFNSSSAKFYEYATPLL